jgi:hypothetical protein
MTLFPSLLWHAFGMGKEGLYSSHEAQPNLLGYLCGVVIHLDVIQESLSFTLHPAADTPMGFGHGVSLPLRTSSRAVFS